MHLGDAECIQARPNASSRSNMHPAEAVCIHIGQYASILLPIALYPSCCHVHLYPLRDELTGEEFEVKAKSVINATGPFTDSIRKMDDGQTRDIVCPSAGIHIMLPDYYSPGASDSSLILIVLF